jgi:hypothetical protein
MIKNITVFAVFLCSALFAGPKIYVKNQHFDAGLIREGEKLSVKHAFKIKNTGNAPLKIKKVKPG